MPNNLPTLDPTAQAADGRYPARVLIGLGIALLAGLAVLFALRQNAGSPTENGRPSSFDLDLSDQLTIAPERLAYTQSAVVSLEVDGPRAIASGPDDRIYVLGDRALHVFDAAAVQQEVMNIDGRPTCLALTAGDHSDAQRLYVGTTEGIGVLAARREWIARWPLPDEQTLFTSLAATATDLFAADAANRVIWRYSTSGEVLGKIGAPDAARNIPGFIVPSPHFDIALGSEGLLYSVNPGKLQVAAFSFDGDLGTTWGRAGSRLSDFFGCCNPAHLAMLADGRFVTSEKGIPRIKVYSAAGVFESVVAGPEQLGIDIRSVGDPRQMSSEQVFDIAVDRHDRILVLDAKDHLVRIFTAVQP